MKSSRIWLALLLFLSRSPVSAETAPKAPPKAKEKSEWVFSLLPKSLQKNPYLELTVVTEMTDEGKKLPPVTPAQPAFYFAQSGGYHPLGDNSGARKTMPQPEVERLLTTALASAGYLSAELPTHPPTVAVFYTWGTHNLLVEGDAENPSLSANQVAANLLDRARLVGGEKFARKMLELFNQADDLNISATASLSGSGQPLISGSGFINPVALFKTQDQKNGFLVDQTANDIYYIVASAYDYHALTAKQRKLLWRTSMTVAANGVSEVETLPTLIATAAPFLGKEMAGPEVLTKRAVREGQVEVGTPTVIAPAGNKPSEKK